MLVVGIGHPDRGDDAVGPLVAQALEGRIPARVDVRVRSGDILGLLEDWAGYDAVILIDAALGSAPGRLHRIDLREQALPRDLTLTSSHGFGIAEAIALAETLQRLPPRVTLYAIEAADFDGPVSAPVAAAVGSAATRILAELQSSPVSAISSLRRAT